MPPEQSPKHMVAFKAAWRPLMQAHEQLEMLLGSLLIENEYMHGVVDRIIEAYLLGYYSYYYYIVPSHELYQKLY